MVSMTLLLIKEFKIYALKSVKITIFPFISLNVDSSHIGNRLFRFSVVIIEGTVSHIFYVGLSLYFM